MKKLMFLMLMSLGLMFTSCEGSVDEIGPGSGNGYCPIHGYNMDLFVEEGTDFGSLEFYQNADGYIFPLYVAGKEVQDEVVFIQTAKLYENSDNITYGPSSRITLSPEKWGQKIGTGKIEDGTTYIWYAPDHKKKKDLTFRIKLIVKSIDETWDGSNSVETGIN